MTTSGTTTFTVSRDTIINAALRGLHAFGPTDTIPAADITYCAEALNIMIKAWAAKGMLVWTVQELVVPTVAGMATYQIGPTATGTVTGGGGVSGITMTNNGTSGTAPMLWQLNSITPSTAWTAITWNGSIFCAVSSTNTCATSPDGITWTFRTFPSLTGGNPTSIAWNGALFVVVGGSGNTNNYATSPDGINWTIRSLTLVSSTYIGSVCYGNGLFVIHGYVSGASGEIYTSPNGISWTRQTTIFSAPNSSNSISWNGTVFCAIGNAFSANTYAFTSPDGINWTQRTLPTSAQWNSIAWNGSIYLAISGGTAAATSPDGVTWTARTIPSSQTWKGISSQGSTFCISNTGSNTTYTTTDGITWTLETVSGTVTGFSAIASNGSYFCAVPFNSSTSIITSYFSYPYAGTYAITFTGGGGSGAAGTYTISSTTGQITSTAITSSGTGYTSAPTVSFIYGGISGATGTASIVSTSGNYLVTTSRPMRVFSAFMRDANGNDQDIKVESRFDYNLLGQKTSSGTPNQLFYDPQFPNGIVTLYNVPADNLSTLHLVIQRQVQDFNLSTDNPDFPQEFYQALKWGLMDEIALEYEANPMTLKIVAAKAQQYLNDMVSFDQEEASVTFSPSFRGY